MTCPCCSSGARQSFRAAATPSDLIKKNLKIFGVQCTQCQKILDKLLKCSKVLAADSISKLVTGAHRMFFVCKGV
ncbi:hypothetical protein P692DRAFT_20317586 [Suillus brevipes Sb2]|nr:hypothetical protein P692DRAFT_20317586 [Suillus brevipes Sb2]